MNWEVLHHGTGEQSLVTYGRRDRYAIVVAQAPGGEPCGVTLTRWPVEHDAHDPYMQGAAAARNAIVFPLGRGPGRPAAEPELDALLSCAKVYAEAYEAGEDLRGYPCWQHAGPKAPYPGFPERYPSGADTQLTGTGELGGDAAFEIAYRPGDANDCRHC